MFVLLHLTFVRTYTYRIRLNSYFTALNAPNYLHKDFASHGKTTNERNVHVANDALFVCVYWRFLPATSLVMCVCSPVWVITDLLRRWRGMIMVSGVSKCIQYVVQCLCTWPTCTCTWHVHVSMYVLVWCCAWYESGARGGGYTCTLFLRCGSLFACCMYCWHVGIYMYIQCSFYINRLKWCLEILLQIMMAENY